MPLLVPAPLEVTPSGLSEAALVMMADRAISECCAIPAESRDAPDDQEVKRRKKKETQRKPVQQDQAESTDKEERYAAVHRQILSV